MEPLDVTCHYDDGCFDKDEQGWVTNATAVTQQGDVVTVRRWGDRNGLDPYEHSVTARLGQHFPELGLVKLEPGKLYIDLVKRRVLDASHGAVLTPGMAPADYQQRLAAALPFVVKLAGLLGAPRQEAPMPEVVFSGDEWTAPFGSGVLEVKRGYNFQISYEHGPCLAKIFIRDDLRCEFVGRGPLELHRAAADVAKTWDWT